jgi:hypothetical protein
MADLSTFVMSSKQEIVRILSTAAFRVVFDCIKPTSLTLSLVRHEVASLKVTCRVRQLACITIVLYRTTHADGYADGHAARACVHACMRACVHACMRACVQDTYKHAMYPKASLTPAPLSLSASHPLSPWLETLMFAMNLYECILHTR